MIAPYFDAKKLETQWMQHWESSGYFKPNTQGDNAYCIVIPPPNVTGSLHMGHAFQYTVMDALIRYHRMQGDKTLWQVGLDHAGIATQMVVERNLQADNLDRKQLGRDRFVEKIWDWKKQATQRIQNQIRRLGASCDWDRERFTLDPGLSEAVQKVFITLYQEGFIYRGKKLVNWDPVLHTAVSDLEVHNKEQQGKLWYLLYPVANSEIKLTIATTRPETLLGDTAVAVHPDDPRYQALIGKQIQHPLTNRLIPIIADPYVDPTFGSGCLKITPAHDFNDYELGQKHNLDLISIFDHDAKINTQAPQAYQGLDRFVARQKILDDLKQLNLIEKIEDHVLKIPYGDRSHAVLEPLLTDQWFVKVAPLAKLAIEAVEKGDLKFVPDNWSKTYFDWMHHIQDWCISRQIWWGHRIPAWYDQKNNIYVGKNETDVREKYQLTDDLILTQDDDVLDTWFSSALWPFSSLGWPKQTADFKTFYPNNILVTGFDIIFFWVARMIMLGLKFTDQVPFPTVYIHGLIQDHEGQKMSKSKGNILDPIDLIDGISLDALLKKRTQNLMQPQMADKIAQKTRLAFPKGIAAYGTDPLRFTYCALATHGRHLRFDLARLEEARHFCHKIWNAARYVLMRTTDYDPQSTPHLTLPDRWILSHWQTVKQSISQHFKTYRFDLLAHALYEFVWNEYCDWYLELSKPVLQHDQIDPKFKNGTCHTLLTVLEEMLCALHPIMPFITEELWQKIKPLLNINTPSIMLTPYPQADLKKIDPQTHTEIHWIKQVILGIRNIRGEMNISPKQPLPVFFQNISTSDHALIKAHSDFLKTLANIKSIQCLEKNEKPGRCATALIGELSLFIPIANLIDPQAEIARLEKEIHKIETGIDACEKRLANSNYVNKAPKAVVLKEREKLKAQTDALKRLQVQKNLIQSD